MMTTSGLKTPDRILAAASALFYSRGFGSVSVDAIAEQAGLTKVTVYQHFRSKEELLIECLQMRLRKREEALDARLSSASKSTDALLVVFDWLAEKAVERDFHGCAFVKAANEVGEESPQVRKIARESKDVMRRRLKGLAVAAGLANAQEIAEELAVLFEGAQVLCLVQGNARPVAAARRAALGIVARTREAQPN